MPAWNEKDCREAARMGIRLGAPPEDLKLEPPRNNLERLRMTRNAAYRQIEEQRRLIEQQERRIRALSISCGLLVAIGLLLAVWHA